MAFVKYIIDCLVGFLDVWSGSNYDTPWSSIIVAFVFIAITMAMYFLIYWRVISPKCCELWLSSVLTFVICTVIWGLFILLCIGIEWMVGYLILWSFMIAIYAHPLLKTFKSNFKSELNRNNNGLNSLFVCLLELRMWEPEGHITFWRARSDR